MISDKSSVLIIQIQCVCVLIYLEISWPHPILYHWFCPQVKLFFKKCTTYIEYKDFRTYSYFAPSLKPCFCHYRACGSLTWIAYASKVPKTFIKPRMLKALDATAKTVFEFVLSIVGVLEGIMIFCSFFAIQSVLIWFFVKRLLFCTGLTVWIERKKGNNYNHQKV